MCDFGVNCNVRSAKRESIFGVSQRKKKKVGDVPPQNPEWCRGRVAGARLRHVLSAGTLALLTCE